MLRVSCIRTFTTLVGARATVTEATTGRQLGGGRVLPFRTFRIGSVHSRLHGSVTLTCMHTVQGDAMQCTH
jgi:hypothetical protein